MGGRGAKAGGGGGGGGGGGAATKAEVTDKDAIDIKKSAARELKNALSETGDTWNNKTVAQRRRLLNEAVEDGMMPSVTSKAQQIYNLRGGKIDQDGRVLDQKLNNKIHNSLVRKLVDNKITPGAKAGRR